MARGSGFAALVVTLALAAGCGGKDAPVAAPSTQTSATASPTAVPLGTPTSAPAPRKNLPTSYPLAQVPLVDGRIQRGSGTPDVAGGGWDVSVLRDGSAADCLAAAGAALVDRGFTEQVVRSGGATHEAQYTSPQYAVLLSASDDPGRRGCTVKYTVGALGG